jgi:hypothetical protein
MQSYEQYLEEHASQRRAEAERIALRMGFHGAFVQASAAAETARASDGRTPLAAQPPAVSWRGAARRLRLALRYRRTAAAGCRA